MPKCFVIMGFGKKTDYKTGRVLDLDASYKNMIKPAVEAAGLECVRADEIVHAGVIDVPMYEQIFSADLVVADLSTANSNAFYELGVRHAMRPFTTIIIAEDQFVYPFDVNHTVIRTYKHLGDDIGVSEANRFGKELKEAIRQIMQPPPPFQTDSPVYTYLPNLAPPLVAERAQQDAAAREALRAAEAPRRPAGVPEPAAPADPSLAVLREQARLAQQRGDFQTAKSLLGAVREMLRPKAGDVRQEDPYVIQQLALVTYKSKLPSAKAALQEARDLLAVLGPTTSNDTETLGLWGAVHKRLWEIDAQPADLDEAVRAYERGFYLRNDHYNGINFAYLLNIRAAHAANRAEAIADFVQAERVRREVITIGDGLLKPPNADSLPKAEKYWILASWAEALVGIGDDATAQQKLAEAAAFAEAGWMTDSTQQQIAKLRELLADSPLRFVQQ